MFDEVQRGWLDSDDYRVATEAAGVVEVPDGPEPESIEPEDAGPAGPPPSYQDLPTVRAALGEVSTGRWTDDDPGSVGK